jgi:hypothetical protein
LRAHHAGYVWNFGLAIGVYGQYTLIGFFELGAGQTIGDPTFKGSSVRAVARHCDFLEWIGYGRI